LQNKIACDVAVRPDGPMRVQSQQVEGQYAHFQHDW